MSVNGSNNGGRHDIKRKRKKGRAGKIVLGFLFLTAIIIGILAGKISYTVNHSLDKLNRNDSVDLSKVEAGYTLSSDKIINILLVGSDERRRWNEPGRSDSVMILTLDLKHKQIKLTSLMRDMYLNIPGYGENRFNAAFSYGGIELLYKTIAENFGISVQGYAVVDFFTFIDAIDEIGGVNIKLTPEEHEYLTGAYPSKKSIQKLKVGKNKMNGYQALAYCRIRQDAQADFGRTKRQRKVLSAVFKKVKNMSLPELINMADIILPNITTDLSNAEIIGYIKDVLFMGNSRIYQYRIPADGCYSPQIINGMDVLTIDLEENRRRLNEFIENERTGRG